MIGVLDEKFGEEICAWVKIAASHQLDEDELRAYCKEEMAHYKIPRHIKFVDEFPMAVTGKIQKLCVISRKKN